MISNILSTVGETIVHVGERVQNFMASTFDEEQVAITSTSYKRQAKRQKETVELNPRTVISPPPSAPASTVTNVQEISQPNKLIQPFSADNNIEGSRPRVSAFSAGAEELPRVAAKFGNVELDTISWNRGSYNKLRRIKWADAQKNETQNTSDPKKPISYQEAILAQPRPMLSPIRGTSQPQGIRAIMDASAGRTMSTYNPDMPAISVPIPSNANAGSLDSEVRVNIIQTPTQSTIPTGDVTTASAPPTAMKAGFGAMFDASMLG